MQAGKRGTSGFLSINASDRSQPSIPAACSSSACFAKSTLHIHVTCVPSSCGNAAHVRVHVTKEAEETPRG